MANLRRFPFLVGSGPQVQLAPTGVVRRNVRQLLLLLFFFGGGDENFAIDSVHLACGCQALQPLDPRRVTHRDVLPPLLDRFRFRFPIEIRISVTSSHLFAGGLLIGACDPMA